MSSNPTAGYPERAPAHAYVAVRALRGATQDVAFGVSFLPTRAIDPMRWGVSHEPEVLLATVCAQLHLDFVFVSASEPWSQRAVGLLRESRTASFWVVDGPLGSVASSLGWGETLRRTVTGIDRLAPLMDQALEVALSQVGVGIAVGASAVVVAEDLAGSSGPLVSPDFANEELVPRLARAARAAEAHGLPAVLHCDGDSRAFLAGAARAGFSAVHVGGVGGEAFVRIMREARARGMRIVGGIEGDALRAGAPAAVRAGTQASLFALVGDLLVADDGSISTPEEFSAFVSALEAARGES